MGELNISMRSQAGAWERGNRLQKQGKKVGEMEDKKFVAFLDILGFKELVKNNSHSYLVEKFKKFLFLNQYGLSNGKINSNATNQDELFNTDISKVNLISISDSIVLYTDDNTIDDFLHIIDAVSTLLNIGIKNGFPLRGELSSGYFSAILKENKSLDFDYSNQILLGKALVEAYTIESKQEWAGCIISDKCFQIFEEKVDNLKLKYYKNNYKIINYNVPIKGTNTEQYVVNWVKDSTINNNQVKEAFQKHNKIINDNVKTKIKNTLDFFNYIYKNHYFYEPKVTLEEN